MKVSHLYGLALAFTIVSWTWLSLNYSVEPEHHTTLCLFKHATGFACPACGTTRSVVELTHGHVANGLSINPFGVLALGFMVSVPLWMAYDFLRQRTTMLMAYKRIEDKIRTKPWLYGMLIVLALANWCWNIQKGL